MLVTKIKLALNAVGVVLGLTGIVCFAYFDNQLATLFAFVTLLYASLNVILHALHLKNLLHTIYSTSILKEVACFAFCSGVILLGILAYIIFLIVYWKMPFTQPASSSYVIKAVWVFLSMKYSWFLYHAANSYVTTLGTTGRPLLQSD